MQGGRENRYPVVGQEKCVEPSEKRKVAKSNEGVVRKVDGVMLVLRDLSDVLVDGISTNLGHTEVFDCGNFVSCVHYG